MNKKLPKSLAENKDQSSISIKDVDKNPFSLLKLSFEGIAKIFSHGNKYSAEQYAEFVYVLNKRSNRISTEIVMEIQSQLPIRGRLKAQIEFKESLEFEGIIQIIDYSEKLNEAVKLLVSITDLVLKNVIRREIETECDVVISSINLHVEAEEVGKDNISPLKKFVWWCSGASSQFLINTPVAQPKYTLLGVCILFTAILHSAIGFISTYSVFNNILPAFLLCLLWGILILNTDRFILLSLITQNEYQKKFINRVLPLIPRIILASIISITFSIPVQLILFKDDIQKQNQIINSEAVSDIDRSINQAKIEIEDSENRSQQENLAVEAKLQNYLDEVDGVKGTRVAGSGIVAKTLYKVYTDEKEEYKKNKTVLDDKIQNKKVEIADLETQRSLILNSSQSIDDSLFSKIDNLNKLKIENSVANYIGWIITLLIFILDVIPFLLIVFFLKGEYEFKIDLQTKETKKQLLEDNLNINELNIEMQKAYTKALDSSLLNPREEK